MEVLRFRASLLLMLKFTFSYKYISLHPVHEMAGENVHFRG